MGAPDDKTQAAACPRCGAALEGDACPACAPAPAPPADPTERTLIPVGPTPDYGVEVQLLACEGCETHLALPVGGAAARCPLCGGATLVARAFAGTGPTTVAPFAVPPARAQAIFHRWLARLRLAPADFVKLARARGLRGVYLPLWTVDATLRSRWSAEAAPGPSTSPPVPGTGPPPTGTGRWWRASAPIASRRRGPRSGSPPSRRHG